MNKKILVAGNANYGLAKELYNLYPDATFMSRSTGYDLTSAEGQAKASVLMLDCDIFINCSALWKFNQTVLLDKLYKFAVENNKCPYIICIGSTTDRVKKGGAWLYNAEKKALRDYCNTLGIAGVWEGKPKVTLISYGSLSNVSEKHPTRTCLDITVAASYIKWLIDQPNYICINEISIDPLQKLNE
jgi:NADP-dependent 3-hydroxy acid dehydrogenase YdfG